MWKFGCIFFLYLISASGVKAEADEQEESASAPTSCTTLVVGATGNTGKHVVQQLLDQGRPVHVIVRSADRMRGLLNPKNSNRNPLLTITEASLLDLPVDKLQAIVDDTHDVVSCLGHTMNFKGLFGQPRRLVTMAAQRLTQAMLQAEASSGQSSSCGPRKFILMNSEGVAHENDDRRKISERIVLAILRKLVPPHADNEAAAAYVQSLSTDSAIEWCVVRPTNLIDSDAATKYVVADKPLGNLFGSGDVVTRANVAKFMVDLIVNDAIWDQYRFQFPVVYDKDAQSTSKSEL